MCLLEDQLADWIGLGVRIHVHNLMYRLASDFDPIQGQEFMKFGSKLTDRRLYKQGAIQNYIYIYCIHLLVQLLSECLFGDCQELHLGLDGTEIAKETLRSIGW